MRRQPVRSSTTEAANTSVTKSATTSKKQQQQQPQQSEEASDRDTWAALAVKDSSALKLGAVVAHRGQLWRARYIGPVASSSITHAAACSKLYVGLELLQPRDEPAVECAVFMRGPVLSHVPYLTCSGFAMMVALDVLFPPLLQARDEKRADGKPETSDAICQTVSGHNEEEEEKDNRIRRQTVQQLQLQVQELEHRLAAKAKTLSGGVDTGSGAQKNADESVHQLLDLLRRQALHDGVLLEESVTVALKAPQVRNSDSGDDNNCDDQATPASAVSFPTLKPLQARLDAWISDVELLQAAFLPEVDACQSKIARRADCAIETARRLLFDAEDLVRTTETAALEGEVTVLHLLAALQQASMAAVSACAVISSALGRSNNSNSSSSSSGGRGREEDQDGVIQIEQQFTQGALAAAKSALLDLKNRHDMLAADVREAHEATAGQKVKTHEEAEQLVSAFAKSSYRVDKAAVAEKRDLYEQAESAEKAAMDAVLRAMEILKAATSSRQHAKSALTRACEQAQQRRTQFGKRLQLLRDTEEQLAAEEGAVAETAQRVDGEAASKRRDLAQSVEDCAGEQGILAREAWLRLHHQHAEAHRAMILLSGQLVFRHRAGSIKNNNKAKKDDTEGEVELQLRAIEAAVAEADARFRTVSLPCLQFRENLPKLEIAKKNAADDDASRPQNWIDPAIELQQLLLEKHYKLNRTAQLRLE